MKRLPFALPLVLVLSAVVPALADPTNDVKNAFVKLATASSYHVQIEAHGKTLEGDVAPPDKSHFVMPPMEMIMLGKTTYVKINGSWMQFAVPGVDKMFAGYQQVTSMAKTPENVSVTDLGMKSPDGAPLHAYSIKNTDSSTPAIVYVDGSGSAVRVDETSANGTSIIRFSNFNVPVNIVAPI